ncbi:MAG: carboxylate--amine ligase [bacterium]
MNNIKSGGSKPYAVVVGLDCMTGLQTVRILAQHGVSVIAIAKNPNHFTCYTKVCEKILIADTSSDEFIETLEGLSATLDSKAVLFPCTDMSVLQISRSRERLAQGYHIALPESGVVEMLMDKIAFIKFAKNEGLPIPTTFFLEKRQDLEEAADQLSYPCILKPPMKSPRWEKNTKKKVYKITDKADLFQTYDMCSEWADILMVQDCVQGTDANLYSCNCYFDRNVEPLVSFIARKLRQWPPEIGTSCLGEEVFNDVVLETSLALFRKVGYHGLGYVEMKKDQRTGKHFIIEPNIGRPTGRSAIAEAGGVELLYTKYCDLVGLPLPENRVQRYTGVKWIYLRRDLQSAYFYWRRGDLSLLDWWRTLRGRKGYAVFSISDPVPFLADFFNKLADRFFSRKTATVPGAARSATQSPPAKQEEEKSEAAV